MNGITKVFYILFNKILEFEEIPFELKRAVVSPVLKSNKNKNMFSSYHCISVQPNIFRIFETIILNKLKPFLSRNNIIPDCQYGYRDKIGISNFHIDLQKIIYKTFNNKDYLGVDLVFLDLSDAFNTVCHQILLSKPRSFIFQESFSIF